MKLQNQFLILFICLSANLCGQVLIIPFGNSISADGTLNNVEWQDADTIVISHANSLQTRVMYKHDGTHLLIAYQNHLQSAGFYLPEILIDPLLDGGTSTQADDWWFHVSATDCEKQGQYGDYDSCMLVRPNWTANPNFSTSGAAVNEIEIKIPFSTLNLKAGDSLGIGFLIQNFQSYRYYPTFAHHLNPSSWKTAVLQNIQTDLERNSKAQLFDLFPNPAADVLYLSTNNLRCTFVRIYDLNGRVIKSVKLFPDMKTKIDVRSFQNGIYIVEVVGLQQAERKKMLIRH